MTEEIISYMTGPRFSSADPARSGSHIQRWGVNACAGAVTTVVAAHVRQARRQPVLNA